MSPRVARPPCQKCGQVHARCTSHTKNATRGPAGRPCNKHPMQGQDVCHSHGGGSTQARRAAARRLEEAAAVKAVVTLGLPVDVSPTEALLQEVQWTAGHVHWLRSKVQEVKDANLVWGVTRTETEAGGTLELDIADGDVVGVGAAPANKVIRAAAPSLWYELYTRERHHLVVVCAAALKAGVEERRVRLAESQGDLVATAIRHILDALELTPEQSARVPQIVPQQLRLIAGGQA